jgi:hypothetical protein
MLIRKQSTQTQLRQGYPNIAVQYSAGQTAVHVYILPSTGDILTILLLYMCYSAWPWPEQWAKCTFRVTVVMSAVTYINGFIFSFAVFLYDVILRSQTNMMYLQSVKTILWPSKTHQKLSTSSSPH